MNTSPKTFQDLAVWHKAHELTLKIYHVTNQFPDSEKYGVVNQMRRAASSIAANIAEGSQRRTSKDLRHFLDIAQGSNKEIRSFLILAKDLSYLSPQSFNELYSLSDEIGAMLFSLARTIIS